MQYTQHHCYRNLFGVHKLKLSMRWQVNITLIKYSFSKYHISGNNYSISLEQNKRDFLWIQTNCNDALFAGIIPCQNLEIFKPKVIIEMVSDSVTAAPPANQKQRLENSCQLTWIPRWIFPWTWWCHQMETFPRFWPFVGGIHRHRWIPHTKASDAEFWWFLWSAPEPTVEQTMETPVTWDAIALIVTSLLWMQSLWE